MLDSSAVGVVLTLILLVLGFVDAFLFRLISRSIKNEYSERLEEISGKIKRVSSISSAIGITDEELLELNRREGALTNKNDQSIRIDAIPRIVGYFFLFILLLSVGKYFSLTVDDKTTYVNAFYEIFTLRGGRYELILTAVLAFLICIPIYWKMSLGRQILRLDQQVMSGLFIPLLKSDAAQNSVQQDMIYNFLEDILVTTSELEERIKKLEK